MVFFFACFMRRSDKDKQASEYLQNSEPAHLAEDEEYLHSMQVTTNSKLAPSLRSCFQGRIDFQMSTANATHPTRVQCSGVAARATAHGSEDVDDASRNRHLPMLSLADQSVHLISARHEKLRAGQSLETLSLERQTDLVGLCPGSSLSLYRSRDKNTYVDIHDS